MYFNSADVGLVQDVDFLISTDTTSYPLADKARNMNRYLEEVVSLILQSDGRWQWDDTNQTDLPIGTSTLVSDQQDYSLSGATYLKILRVEVKNINGNYQQLIPIDQSEIRGTAMSEFNKTAGMPKYYDPIGDSIMLYPKPSSSQVTLTAGLKVYFQRPPSYFTAASTTTSPGFAPLYHRYLSYGAALDYAIQNEMNSKINLIRPLMDRMKQDIINFYSSRQPDAMARLTPAHEDYGTGCGTRVRDTVAF